MHDVWRKKRHTSISSTDGAVTVAVHRRIFDAVQLHCEAMQWTPRTRIVPFLVVARLAVWRKGYSQHTNRCLNEAFNRPFELLDSTMDGNQQQQHRGISTSQQERKELNS